MLNLHDTTWYSKKKKQRCYEMLCSLSNVQSSESWQNVLLHENLSRKKHCKKYLQRYNNNNPEFVGTFCVKYPTYSEINMIFFVCWAFVYRDNVECDECYWCAIDIASICRRHNTSWFVGGRSTVLATSDNTCPDVYSSMSTAQLVSCWSSPSYWPPTTSLAGHPEIDERTSLEDCCCCVAGPTRQNRTGESK